MQITTTSRSWEGEEAGLISPQPSPTHQEQQKERNLMRVGLASADLHRLGLTGAL